MSTADDPDRELICRFKVLLILVGRGYEPTPKEKKALQMFYDRCKPTDAREN